jgi:hypothetical protein
MIIFAVVAVLVGGIIVAAALTATWAVSPVLAVVAVTIGLAVLLVAYWATSTSLWGQHGRRGPRARCSRR